MNSLQKLLYKELFSRSFYEFVKYFWNCADPSKFVDGNLIQFYCESLIWNESPFLNRFAHVFTSKY